MVKKFSEIVPINNVKTFISDLQFIDIFDDSNEKVLYHYTSGEGLKSIIENKALWITKGEFLNDRGEIRYTHNLILKIIDEFMSENPKDEEWEFKKFIEKGIDNGRFLVESYILSLSTNNDSNLLWSNYARNDGYNIGFCYPNIKNALSQALENDEVLSEGVVISNSVLYDEEQQREHLFKEIVDLYKIYILLRKNNELDNFYKLANKIVVNIYIYIYIHCFLRQIALNKRKNLE